MSSIASIHGFSLHGGVVIPDYDREALERLCRYGARPALAHDRLAWTTEGRVSYKLKRPWPDGRTLSSLSLSSGPSRPAPRPR
jgi:hypothetical protein